MAPATSGPASSLPRRLLGAAALPFLLAVAWAGGAWLAVLAVLAALRGGWEVESLARAGGLRPIRWSVPLLALLLTLAAGQLPDTHGQGAVALLGMGAAGAVAAAPVLLGRSAVIRWRAWLAPAAGAAYVALPLAAALLLRNEEQGWQWLLLALLATFATDTSAYATGRLLGRRPMAPSISPGKTWEGAIGGLLGGAAATVGLAAVLGLGYGVYAALALGAGVSVAGQAGDLGESKLKRWAGVKEAGSLIPGHGGLLDRMDSLVLTIPLVYYVATTWPPG